MTENVAMRQLYYSIVFAEGDPFGGLPGEGGADPLEVMREKLRKEVLEYLEQRYRVRRRFGGYRGSFDRFLHDEVTVRDTLVWLLGRLRELNR